MPPAVLQGRFGAAGRVELLSTTRKRRGALPDQQRGGLAGRFAGLHDQRVLAPP